MSDLFLLGERQMVRIAPYFTLAYGVPPVNDRDLGPKFPLGFRRVFGLPALITIMGCLRHRD